MHVFLCAFQGFSLAIPISHISYITLREYGVTQDIEYNHKNRNTYISLPHLFNLPPEDTRHGIVLKSPDSEEDELQNDDEGESQIILLTTEVKCEAEIPDEEIYPIPKIFDGIRFSELFSGIQFNSHKLLETTGGLVLFLNIKQMVQSLQKGHAA